MNISEIKDFLFVTDINVNEWANNPSHLPFESVTDLTDASLKQQAIKRY